MSMVQQDMNVGNRKRFRCQLSTPWAHNLLRRGLCSAAEDSIISIDVCEMCPIIYMWESAVPTPFYLCNRDTLRRGYAKNPATAR